MEQLYREIESKFVEDNSGFKTAVLKLHDTYIPQTSKYPCAVRNCISDFSADTFTESISRIVLQIDIYTDCDSSGPCHVALKAAIKFFTGQIFTPEGLADVQFIKDRVQHPRREGKLWRGSVDLRAVVQQTEE